MPSIEIIAEVATNHGGSIPLAKEFIKRFAAAGADWVKFQTFDVRHLSSTDHQFQWMKRAQLRRDDHETLIDTCKSEGTKFLTTVYNSAEVPFLQSLGLQAIKIGSGEAREPALAEAVLDAFPRVLVSLGLCQNDPWQSVFEAQTVEYLGCCTRYPAPLGVAGVVMRSPTYATTGPWKQVTGWSDHAVGLNELQLAVVSGATLLETHVCLPTQARPIRSYEKTVEDIRELRAWVDLEPERFLGRWQR